MAVINSFDAGFRTVRNCSFCDENETCVPSGAMQGGYVCVVGNRYYQKMNYSIINVTGVLK